MNRKPYPTDVSQDEWAFVAPYLSLMTEQGSQRKYPLREIFNAVRWIVRAGAPWRLLPTNFPPWAAVYQQMQRWIKAECFEAIIHDLREMLRLAQGRNKEPSAVILDSRTLRSTPESGHRAGFEGHKKTKGSKVPIAVDTLGHLLAVSVTPTNENHRTQVAQLTLKVQEETGHSVKAAFVDQGYTGETPAQAARRQGIDLFVVKLQEAKHGFILLPKRWVHKCVNAVVERDFAWASRFRRLARDYERLPQTLAGIRFVVFAVLMLAQVVAHTINLST